jgi:hypothetical protein
LPGRRPRGSRCQTAIRFACLLVCLLGRSTIASGEGSEAASGDRPNGFVLDDLRVDRETVVEGGPARDAIRSIDAPRFVSPDEARWVTPDTPVVGVATNGRTRAYPVHLMEWHQIVNERIDGSDLIVVYDPLTDMAAAWRSAAGATRDTFGVSGLLDRNGFLIYDRATSSLWSPISGRAISGTRAGEGLASLPVRVETMARWLARHPDTFVLALPERDRIDYRRSPYSRYWTSEDVPLAVEYRDDRFHPKEVVLGVEIEGKTRAYLGSIVTRAGGRIVDDFASKRIRVAYDGESGTFSYDAPEEVTVHSAYWFAWKNLHPATGIWREDLAETGHSVDGKARAPSDASATKSP